MALQSITITHQGLVHSQLVLPGVPVAEHRTLLRAAFSIGKDSDIVGLFHIASELFVPLSLLSSDFFLPGTYELVVGEIDRDTEASRRTRKRAWGPPISLDNHDHDDHDDHDDDQNYDRDYDNYENNDDYDYDYAEGGLGGDDENEDDSDYYNNNNNYNDEDYNNSNNNNNDDDDDDDDDYSDDLPRNYDDYGVGASNGYDLEEMSDEDFEHNYYDEDEGIHNQGGMLGALGRAGVSAHSSERVQTSRGKSADYLAFRSRLEAGMIDQEEESLEAQGLRPQTRRSNPNPTCLSNADVATRERHHTRDRDDIELASRWLEARGLRPQTRRGSPNPTCLSNAEHLTRKQHDPSLVIGPRGVAMQANGHSDILPSSFEARGLRPQSRRGIPNPTGGLSSTERTTWDWPPTRGSF